MSTLAWSLQTVMAGAMLAEPHLHNLWICICTRKVHDWCNPKTYEEWTRIVKIVQPLLHQEQRGGL